MISQTPRMRGRKPDLITSTPKGKSQRPQKISLITFPWPCRRRNSMARASRWGFSNTARKSAPRKRVRAAMLFSTFINPTAAETRARGHHVRSMRRVHTAEQTVESHDYKDENDRRDQVSDDAETEKRLVSQDVAGGRGGVPAHEQSAGNIDQVEGGGDH